MSDWFSVTEFDDGIYRIDEEYVDLSERGLMYFVRGRKHNLLIDGGYGLVPLRANVALFDEGDTLALATHTHFDHIGAMWEFEQRAVHPIEAHVLANPTQTNTLILPYLVGGIPFSKIPEAWRSLEEYHITPAPATQLLADGDIIDLGERQFEIIHTPGHSPGHVALWEAASGILFSSDVVYNGTILDMLAGSNIPDLLQSHQRLLELPVNVCYPGHYEPLSGEHMRQLIANYANQKAKNSQQ